MDRNKVDYGIDTLGWGKTAGGLYVPIKVTDQGEQVMQLSDSTIAVPVDVQFASLTQDTPLYVAFGSNQQVSDDKSAAWADSAVINTTVNLDFALPAVLSGCNKYLVEITNPSTVTALTAVAQIKAAAFGGADRYPELTRWSVLANTTKVVLVEGWLLDGGGRVVLSNDTALGAAQGFTATVRVIKV